MPPIEENVPRREFQPRRRRSFLALRRKRDVAWFLIVTVPFIVSLTLLVFHVKIRRPVAAAEGDGGGSHGPVDGGPEGH